ncbi:hypothetical protein GW17_00036545 [Ensete ventricosum]|nr:hypothetical protein GW17_00036545 [Ensete ventricosum]
MMRLGTFLECVGSSLRVSGACQNDAREFVRRRARLVGRLLGLAEELAGRLDDMVGARKDFAEGIGKIARNIPGDRWRKTVRLTAGNAGGYQITGVRSLSLMVMYDCNP